MKRTMKGKAVAAWVGAMSFLIACCLQAQQANAQSTFAKLQSLPKDARPVPL